MNDFKKIVRIGTCRTYGGRGYSVYCKIEYRGGKLSISGVEGPLPSGNCIGGCGQIDMHLRPSHFRTYARGWNTAKVLKFLEIWDQWHLNDLRAGTPRQMEALRSHWKANPNEARGYDKSREYLESIGLLLDVHPVKGDPHKFGSAWLTEPVPDEALEFLKSLPDADKEPAWV